MPPQDGKPRLHYRYPLRLILRIGCSFLLGQRRPFAQDAGQLYCTVAPPPQVAGLERVPRSGRMAVVFNHYHSRSFASWWSPISIAALIASVRDLGPTEMAWVMTAAWTYRDALRQHLLTPLTEWAFTRLAGLYGFVAMPPMPPRAHEVEARAHAVRHALALVRGKDLQVFGISPEGHDSPDASLIEPPSGVGRFLLLVGASFPIVPVGVCEDGDRLLISFGEPFSLRAPQDLASADRDAWASEQVMLAIGRQLPARLWGAYSARLIAGRG